jgi:hypothetical protein
VVPFASTLTVFGGAVTAFGADLPVEEPPGLAGQPFTDPFSDVLQKAKQAWFEGRVDDALALFEILKRRLSFGERPGIAFQAEALIYLGEVYQSQGRFDDAAVAFRDVLERDPDATINPYHHPPEVVAQFNGVRDLVLAELAAKVVEPIPLVAAPWWTVLPFGVGQFKQGQTGSGVAYAMAQGGLGAASIAMTVSLRRTNGHLPDVHEWPPEGFPDTVRRIQLQRFGVQWPATFGFYGVWAVSVADARIHWRQSQLATRPVLTLSPLPGGADLRVSFQW